MLISIFFKKLFKYFNLLKIRSFSAVGHLKFYPVFLNQNNKLLIPPFLYYDGYFSVSNRLSRELEDAAVF